MFVYNYDIESLCLIFFFLVLCSLSIAYSTDVKQTNKPRNGQGQWYKHV